MNLLRIASPNLISPTDACCRCARDGWPWDRIAGKPYCPHCQEALIMGESDPLKEPTVKDRCAVCDRVGTVRFHTFPRQSLRAVEMDLCPEHLRSLLGRRLGPRAFQQLCRQIRALGLTSEDIFLLHEEFYDVLGRAIRPANDLGLSA